MLKYLKELLFTPSTFKVIDIDHENNFLTVEDGTLGLTRQIGWGHKKLQKYKIISEYEILFTYEDGSTKIEKILD